MNLRGAVQAIIPAPVRARLRRGGPILMDRAQWDREYATGYGEAMGSLAQLPRNSMIAGYCGVLGRRSVLDIGCGIGVLRRHLAPLGYTDYVGVDLSQTAIEQARREAPASARFEVAAAEEYQPGRHFDVIVFNEMLYYLNEPEMLLKRCADFLEKDGVFIISLFDTGQSWRTWWRCADRLTVLDEVRVRRARDRTWRIRMCHPC
jgi:2-polyprenyl-3-methyl-5-hydroxy-6-metoxy-1,4-benzoquinol methylase